MFYGDPPGAILSIAGHKGYALGIITEMLAGALAGGGASNPANADRLANGMLSIYFEPSFFQERPGVQCRGRPVRRLGQELGKEPARAARS